VTDAQARIPTKLRDEFNRWKLSAQARVISLVLAHGAGDLTAIIDDLNLVRTLDPDGEAVGRVLSL
jgi:hypothetical protein